MSVFDTAHSLGIPTLTIFMYGMAVALSVAAYTSRKGRRISLTIATLASVALTSLYATRGLTHGMIALTLILAGAVTGVIVNAGMTRLRNRLHPNAS